MDKLHKLLVVIVIILTFSLITMIILFFNMKNTAYYNYKLFEQSENVIKTLEENLELDRSSNNLNNAP